VQRRPLAKLFDHGFQQFQVGELITVALQEQHRNPHLGQVLRSFVGRPAGSMQREAQKHEPSNAGKRHLGLCRRRHPPAKRLAARYEGQSRRDPGRLDHRRAHGRGSYRGRIGPAGPPLHVGKLIPQGRDAPLRQPLRDRFEERVPHPGTGAVREHVEQPRTVRAQQQPRHVTHPDVSRGDH
jgi:hypothetical protein